MMDMIAIVDMTINNGMSLAMLLTMWRDRGGCKNEQEILIMTKVVMMTIIGMYATMN